MTCGDLRRLLIGVAGHDGGNGASQSAAFVGIVGQTVAHDERAQIGVTEAEGAEDVRILGDVLGRVAGVVHQDFLRGDENADGGLEAFDIELPSSRLNFIKLSEARLQAVLLMKDVFRAGIGGVNRLGAFAGVPLLDGAVVLQAGIAAGPGAVGNFMEQLGGILLFQRGARRWNGASTIPCPRGPLA